MKHTKLDLLVDFSQKRLSGTASLTCEVKRAGTSVVILDTKHLMIDTSAITVDAAAVPCDVQSEVGELGSALHIPIPEALRNAGCTFTATIPYSTTDKCSALQWLPKEQTAGKQHPYLFSQCQAIHARSMLPCQDTPGVKSTYEAQLQVPSELTALMSALSVDQSASGQTVSCTFSQPVAVPSYLIAIVVGNLEGIKVGPRSTVWSEPEMVRAAAEEFSETEQFILAAESIVGPYIWGKYDILCLPPSFPYGGMENPSLTFVTPSLLAGDKSLAGVVAHEIAHSWTGNLVGCRTWYTPRLYPCWLTMYSCFPLKDSLHLLYSLVIHGCV